MTQSLAPEGIRQQVLAASQAMAKYAFAAGMKVPSDIVEKLEALSSIGTETGAVANAASSDEKSKGSPDRVIADQEAASALAGLTDDGARQLTRIHNRLADLVAPATPKAILLLATEEAKGGFWLFLGAVPLIRRLLATAALSMIAFVAVSLSKHVNGLNFDLLKNSGMTLFLSEFFLLTAASIGASFTNLFEAQRYVKGGTFDPKFESSYWVRYVLGLMAGTILALLIPIEALAGSGGEGRGADIFVQLGKPILALLGGFAARAVYSILNRLVTTMESLVAGDASAAAAAHEQMAKARSIQRDIENRVGLSARLNTLEQTISETPDPAEMRKALARLRQELISGEDVEEKVT